MLHHKLEGSDTKWIQKILCWHGAGRIDFIAIIFSICAHGHFRDFMDTNFEGGTD
jgi:hypothetical protein